LDDLILFGESLQEHHEKLREIFGKIKAIEFEDRA
jgi:hypothetical protein